VRNFLKPSEHNAARFGVLTSTLRLMRSLFCRTHKGVREMPQPYRSSAFVDFNAGIVRLDPMQFVDQHPGSRDLAAEIDFFQCRVEVWQLAPAVEILKQIESENHPSTWSHSAYALLFILTPYFEMVGKILNEDSNEYKSSDRDFNLGFCNVYPGHRFSQRTPGTSGLNDNAFPHIGRLRDRLRNGLSHLGFTKTTLDIHNSPNVPDDFAVVPIGTSESDPAPMPFYLVNPHRITRTIVEHFGNFVDDLRKSEDAQLQDKFLEFVGDFHDPHEPGFP
jgi:hypothetical protein